MPGLPLDTVESWMREALDCARRAQSHDEVPVAALLVREGKVIGSGANRRERAGRTIGHAEIEALEDYNRQTGLWRVFPDTSLIVTVEPCLMCTGALLWARVDHIYYGCEDPKDAGLRRVAPLIADGVYDHRITTIQGGIYPSECGSLLSTYFARKRKEKLASETSSQIC